jgi:hypothetical protein
MDAGRIENSGEASEYRKENAVGPRGRVWVMSGGRGRGREDPGGRRDEETYRMMLGWESENKIFNSFAQSASTACWVLFVFAYFSTNSCPKRSLIPVKKKLFRDWENFSENRV